MQRSEEPTTVSRVELHRTAPELLRMNAAGTKTREDG
jgi:hypothetical protein